MSDQVQLPHGYHDARVALVLVAFLGELLQGMVYKLLRASMPFTESYLDVDDLQR